MNAFGLQALGGFLACFARTAALLQAAPLTGDRTVPGRVRAGAAVMIALAITPLRGAVDPAQLPTVLALEIALGLLGGFAARLVMAGIEAGGQLIGLQLELGFAGTFDPSMGDESLPTRRIAHSIGGLCFLAAGGLEALVRGLCVAPLATPSSLGRAATAFLDGGGRVLVAAVRLAAPLIVAALVANLAAALASRAAPALNVFSAAIALVLIVGAATLIGTAPALIRDFVEMARTASHSALVAMGAGR